MYAGRHHPDVQDLGSELPYHRILPFGAVLGRHQVWRLSGYNHRCSDERLLLVHFPSKGDCDPLGIKICQLTHS